MYFSRIFADAMSFDTESRRALLQQPSLQTPHLYAEHQWLWRFFPNTPKGERPFLFRRVSASTELVSHEYYVVSEVAPTPYDALWKVNTKPYYPTIEHGEVLAFDVRVNPIVTRDNKTFDVVMDRKTKEASKQGFSSWSDMRGKKPDQQQYDYVFDACLEWLLKRSRTYGFSLMESSFSANHYSPPLRPPHLRGARKQDFIPISTVDLSGHLIVEDADVFHKTLKSGLGSAKAFGCGLMLIRRT